MSTVVKILECSDILVSWLFLLDVFTSQETFYHNKSHIV